MADDVDKLFEDMFGYGTKPPQKIKAEPKPAPKTKPKPKPAPKTKPPEPVPKPPEPEPVPEEELGTVEDAAKAVSVALEAHHAKKGARKKVKLVFWRPVVSKALGIKRIYEKRLMEVIRKGVIMGLFEIDESGSHPFLVPVPEEEVDPEWEAHKARREVEDARKAAEAQEYEERMRAPRPTPENWDPPSFLDCGHWTWQTIEKPVEDYTDKEKSRAAKAEGTHGTLKPKLNVRVHSPDECHYCRLGQRPDSYQHQLGKHKTVVPERSRRTADKETGPGYPGLCCDEEGYYIGGLVNLCTYANPKGPHCIVHRRGSKRAKEA
jgi:hypothetical protein